ncbi:diacylglycerol/lipid kinase family protein [Enterococcus alishanensis]|uniref:Diacylglycerol kinase family lipid kinase n=1 Tax=Enterococcus alishanensis TaxID=1303817 RepID=A0ABS6TDK8_9ENTE|nr:diacylglycerol kinase family protein [Enterococcus alishanensis]MBV7391007.1 diacylglycerol kinase family lipid kinase [Enterococcus alishanensis]
MKILIIYNQSSGKDTGKHLAEDLKTSLEKNNSENTIDLAETGPKIDPKTLTNKAVSENFDTIVMTGGDGTLRHIVQAFDQYMDKFQFAILPGGTVNNFATALDIPKDPEEVAEIILAGHQKKVDYALVNQKEVLLSSLTVGILADTAANISQQEKQKYGKWPFVRNFVKMLAKKKKYLLSFSTGKKEWQESCQLLAITMSNSVGGFPDFDREATADDGLMHITILPRMHFLMYLMNLHNVLRGQIGKIPTVQYFHESELKIHGKSDIKVRIDGDDAGTLPIEIDVQKHKLTILVP